MQNLQLGASLQGRLRNTDLPVSKCLYPLFEAVVNAIYAIDDRVDSDNAFALSEGRIRVSLEFPKNCQLHFVVLFLRMPVR